MQLLDKRWRRRTIGVVSGSTSDTAQPLLASTYYLSRALNPFADVRLAEVAAPAAAVRRFIEQNVPMIVLADVGNVSGEAHDRLAAWIEDGGMLVRFAGPRLAASDDDLVPVKLRRGGRILGGSLSWEKPQQLAAFSRESPVQQHGGPDRRHRHAAGAGRAGSGSRRPHLGDARRRHAAGHRRQARQGHDRAVPCHRRHPLVGSAAVRQLRRNAAADRRPRRHDHNQRRRRPRAGPRAKWCRRPASSTASARSARRPPPPGRCRWVTSARATADHPPGFYGPPEGLLAVNTLAPADRLVGLDYAPLNARLEAYQVGEPQDLRGPVLLAALALLALDALVVFFLAGGIGADHAAAPAAGRCCSRPRGAVDRAHAWRPGLRPGSTRSARRRRCQRPDTPANLDFAMKATIETRLAYVVTGDAEVDSISKSGLQGLTLFLAQRTALEAGDPVGLDIARDELAFFPLIYWPVVPGAAKPSPAALARIDAYMKNGGTVLFDTRDAIMAPPGPGGANRSPGMIALRTILSSLDIPELEPVSRDHVLTKTFFLLRDFPGRFNSGQLWVEALPTANEQADETKRPARAGDGVSSIIITSNDFAGAWATRSDGQAMLPMVPGEPRQREFAFRAGVNIVMYTLTGNYKADQVHVPALLERLGQ